MSDEDFAPPKLEPTLELTPEEYYFSKSQNEWVMVSDMSDTHIRRAFKRLLRMIRLGQLIELNEYTGNNDDIKFIKNELSSIETHTKNIKVRLND